MPRHARRSTRSALLLAGSVVLAACGGGADDAGDTASEATGPPAAATVNLRPVTFEPADVTIAAGETVEWTWGGGVQHDVEGEGFKSELQAKGKFRHTFPDAGTFDYRCNVHPTTMMGTVTVE